VGKNPLVTRCRRQPAFFVPSWHTSAQSPPLISQAPGVEIQLILTGSSSAVAGPFVDYPRPARALRPVEGEIMGALFQCLQLFGSGRSILRHPRPSGVVSCAAQGV